MNGNPSILSLAAVAKTESVRERFNAVMRMKGYAISTRKDYIHWCFRFAQFHWRASGRTVDALRGPDVATFLSHLANDKNVAVNTQKQAMNAIVCLYRELFKTDLGDFGQFSKASRAARLPLVLAREEVQCVLACLPSEHLLIGQLLYGCGLRLMECMRLRVKDVDFIRGCLTARDVKWGRERQVGLPKTSIVALRQQIERVKLWNANDHASVWMPTALNRKYPNAEREPDWQFVFGQKKLSTDPEDKRLKRHHIHENTIQKVIKQAVDDAAIHKPATCHTLRHSYTTHLYEDGVDILKLKELLGHRDVKTTLIYTHLARRPADCIKSPLDVSAFPIIPSAK